MKKLMFLTILLSSYVFGFTQEYTQLMGISLKETYTSFRIKLVEKGFKNIDVDQSLYWGSLENPSDKCTIKLDNCESDTICLVQVLRNARKNDLAAAKRLYFLRYEKLKEKYGEPCYIATDEGMFDWEIQKYRLYYDNGRIMLSVMKLEEGDMTDLGKGDYKYSIKETYFPLHW
jgi:hypothetical protein